MHLVQTVFCSDRGESDRNLLEYSGVLTEFRWDTVGFWQIFVGIQSG